MPLLICVDISWDDSLGRRFVTSNVTGDTRKWGGRGAGTVSASARSVLVVGNLCTLLPRDSVTLVLRFSKSMRRALERVSEEALIVKQTTKLVLHDNETAFSEMPGG
jgi:hypothetical protein